MTSENSDLYRLMEAGMPFEDARTSLRAYKANPENPGADGVRAKAVLEKDE